MAIHYYRTKKKLWIKGEQVTRYMATRHSQGTLTEEDIAEDLTKALSMEAPEVLLAMDELADQIAKAVLRGQTVKVKGLGTFTPTLKTHGVDDSKQADASAIEKVKINFRADAKLKREVEGADLKYYGEIETNHM